MGYEVLGDDGVTCGAEPPQPPPTDVVPLGDPTPAVDAASTDTRSPVVSLLGRVPRRAWAALALAAALGVGAGALWGADHAQDAEAARLRATVTGVALLLNTDASEVTPDQVMVVHTVRVLNLGTGPITVRTSPLGSQVSSTTLLVTIVNGDPQVPPGGHVLINARRLVGCSPTSTETPLTVPVASTDGTVHQVAVSAVNEGGDGTTAQGMCSSAARPERLAAQLLGTVERPVLRVANLTDRRVRVGLAPDSPYVDQDGQEVTITTHPKLPVTLGPHATKDLTLTVTARRCVSDMSTFTSVYGNSGFYSVQVEDGDNPAWDGSGVDVSGLIGAALARACR